MSRIGEGAPVAPERRGRRVRGASVLVSALAALVVGGGTVAAQSSPREVVRERNETVARILAAEGDSVTAEAREALKDVINGLIDFPELSRRALGRHWEERTEEERQDFVQVFRELVRNSSVRKIEVYDVDSTTYKPPVETEDGIRLETVAHDGSAAVDIVYLMHRVGDEWKAYDVIIDGSSTLRTYQDSFRRELQSRSFQAMYDRMVERLDRSSGASP